MSMPMWVHTGHDLLADIENFTVPSGAVVLWYLGQMGFVAKGASTIVYLDPYLVDTFQKDPTGRQVSRRRFSPPFAGSDVHHAQVVLGSHNHSDHINLPTLTGIAAGSPQAKFVVPEPHVRVLIEAGIDPIRVNGAQAFASLQVGDLTITPIPAAHEELEQDDKGDYLALSYLLRINGITIFHAGDTVEYPGLLDTLRAQRVDICILPINGRDLLRGNRGIIGNMNFREAADLGAAAGASLIIPGHYDVFPNNSENPAYFTDYLYRTYPAQPHKIMAPGERLVYMA